MRLPLLGSLVVLPLLAGCMAGQSVQNVKPEDNVNGQSRMMWTLSPDQRTMRVAVDQKVGDCFIREFAIIPKADPRTGQMMQRVVPPESHEGGSAVIHFPAAPGEVTVVARYVHTILVDEGEEPRATEKSGGSATGQVRVGRMLSKGFTFDHYDFSTASTGPGGAYAWVKEAPGRGAPSAMLLIGWHTDQFSSVTFRWRTYATGPCGVAP